MKVVFNNMTLSGAAFPSCHAAISILALIQTFKYSKPLGLIFLPFVVLLLFSTVYIYAHYAIDTIVGMIVGVLLYLAVPWVASHLANATRLAESRLKKNHGFQKNLIIVDLYYVPTGCRTFLTCHYGHSIKAVNATCIR